jgi:phospholipase C
MIGRPADHTSRLSRGELADEGGIERLRSEDAEAYMRRREFLARTASLAGGAALASLIPADALVAEAAQHQARRPFPSPRNLPLDTIVVLMMENRSFDHYFGWHPRADARNRGLAYPDPEGTMVRTHRLRPDYQGCDFRDPDHSWTGGRFQWHRGRMDGFVMGNREGTGSDEFAAGYYLKEDLSFIPHVAEAFTLCDRYFTSLMASTFPNRNYQWSAQSGGQRDNYIPRTVEGNQWETIFDRAERRGVSALSFFSDYPVSSLYGRRAIPWTRRISEYYERAAAGTLPQICFVDPAFGDIGAFGLGASDHPHSDIRLGQAFMSDVVHAFLESPQYRRGALFINYDEWGGFFDHVEPRFVPDQRRSRRLFQDFGMTGFRIPGVIVSPFARGGRVSHQTVTHESILKLISYRFGLGHLNRRHRYASNIGRSLDFGRRVGDPPALPDPAAIASTPCAVPRSDVRAAKPHDFTRLESTGYLERVGFEAAAPSLDRIFREPDRVRAARRQAEEG